MSGEVPSGWSKRTLGDVARPKQWPTIPQTSFTADGYPVYGANGRIGYFARYTHAEETVAITCRGATCGNVHLTPPFVYITGNAMALDALDQELVGPRYLAFVLRHQGVAECVTGSAQPQIIGSELRRVNLTLPPLPEQRRIAEILDTLDEAIRKTEQVIAKLQQVKQGLLHDLLTRGIDENGELRDPLRHPEQFKDSPLGRIPKEWEVSGVLDVPPSDRQPILTGPFGAQLGAADFRSTGVPVIRIGNVQWGHMDLEDLLFVSENKAQNLQRFRVREGDLLFARQGATTGRNALADRQSDGALINYHIIRVAVDHEQCHPVYLHACFNSATLRAQVDRDKGRGTREGVNTANIASFRFALPDIHEQKRVVGSILGHGAQVSRERESLQKLRLLKQGLMDDLLTGRVRVKVTEAAE